MQVAFDAPLQGSGTTRGVEAGFYPALDPALRRVPRRAADVRRDAARQAGLCTAPAPPPYVAAARTAAATAGGSSSRSAAAAAAATAAPPPSNAASAADSSKLIKARPQAGPFFRRLRLCSARRRASSAARKSLGILGVELLPVGARSGRRRRPRARRRSRYAPNGCVAAIVDRRGQARRAAPGGRGH